MGLIREPKGVDLVVSPSILTMHDRKIISQVIADYKKTGKMPVKSNSKRLRRQKNTTTNK